MAEPLPQFIPTIGLEIHIQLQTESKIFCADRTAFSQEPNTQVSAISLGHPGTLPVLNQEAVRLAIKLGLACGSTISKEVVFDRKNYFYPDLPKGYQITQDRNPICQGGAIPFGYAASEDNNLNLIKIHLEEDAGKSIHDNDATQSQIDYNRAGTPLLELVTTPEITSAENAQEFMMEVRKLVRYLGLGTGNMEQGALRCDANVSVRQSQEDELGSKVEIKNINSFKFVRTAIENEIARQIQLLQTGQDIVSETRDFNAKTGQSSSLRLKESLNDYRYFPEPDISPTEITDEAIAHIKELMPVLPWDYFHLLQSEYKLKSYDAAILSDSREMAEYFTAVCSHGARPKSVANWLLGPLRAQLNKQSLEIHQLDFPAERLYELVQLVDNGDVTFSVASNKLLPKLLESTKSAKVLAEEMAVLIETDDEELNAIIDQVLKENPSEVDKYRSGHKELLGRFMGEIMKSSGGQADPRKAKNLLEEKLNSIS